MTADRKTLMTADRRRGFTRIAVGQSAIIRVLIRGNPRQGQALLELAIFGSLIILTLGTLIQFGLNDDYQQQATMETFRHALSSAAATVLVDPPTPTAVSHVRLKDRHIPDPSNPFTIGFLRPVAAQASVTRNHKLQENIADRLEELPRARITVQDGEVNCGSGSGCTTAGFREDVVPAGSLERYQEIFGSQNVCPAGTECTEGSFPQGPCLKPFERVCTPDPEGGPEICEDVCPQSSILIRVIDTCEGELLSEEGCTQQARQLRDDQVCTQICEKNKSPESDKNCSSVCHQPLVTIPWYAEGEETPGAHDNGTHQWAFLKLQSLFRGITKLGLQPGFRRQTSLTNSLGKTERSDQITTTTSVNWRTEMQRTLLFKPVGDTSGNPAPPLPIATTPKDEQSTTTWTTPW
ncbi:MAG: hypothetical protein Q8R91_07460 [Candidatus Omnitrophota bacterium]|nr:hypothetical protein [Candidatus Omnitrophota bacterium]